jgi:polysaccharide deacetylase family protein (PEP-CTERM system associated)
VEHEKDDCAEMTNERILNAMTVDVEDYFHVAAFKAQISPDKWDSYPLRVGDNTKRVLSLLAQHNTKATFFVLGWVAERLPELVREISDQGHEVASHGYAHQLVYDNSPQHFREDIHKAKTITEQITGKPVKGYRAPTYSITKKSLWALDILAEEGFEYDSSIFPIAHDLYGIPGFNRFPHTIDTSSGKLFEFPITTAKVKVGWKNFTVPVAGGGYLRLIPVNLIERAFLKVNLREKQPVVVYFHPWEIDPLQPRIKAPIKSRFRHYVNLNRTEKKLGRLLGKFQFAPISKLFEMS